MAAQHATEKRNHGTTEKARNARAEQNVQLKQYGTIAKATRKRSGTGEAFISENARASGKRAEVLRRDTEEDSNGKRATEEFK